MYLKTHLKTNYLIFLIFFEFRPYGELIVSLVLLAVIVDLLLLCVDANGGAVEFVGEVIGIAEELLLHFLLRIIIKKKPELF